MFVENVNTILSPRGVVDLGKEEVMRRLREALMKFDIDETQEAAREAVHEDIPALKSLHRLTKTAREIGDKFGRFIWAGIVYI